MIGLSAPGSEEMDCLRLLSKELGRFKWLVGVSATARGQLL